MQARCGNTVAADVICRFTNSLSSFYQSVGAIPFFSQCTFLSTETKCITSCLSWHPLSIFLAYLSGGGQLMGYSNVQHIMYVGFKKKRLHVAEIENYHVTLA